MNSRSAGERAGDILLLGTSHIDPLCGERLFLLLEKHRPDMILLEISPFSLLFRKTAGRIFRSILAGRIRSLGIPFEGEIRLLHEYFGIPAEHSAVMSYAKKTGAAVRLVDVSFFSFLRLALSFRALGRRNLENLAGKAGDRFSLEMRAADRIFNGKDSLLGELRLSGFGKDLLVRRREECLASRVSRYRKKHRGRRMVYVGGWEHCMDDAKGRTLYSRLPGPKGREIIFLAETYPGTSARSPGD